MANNRDTDAVDGAAGAVDPQPVAAAAAATPQPTTATTYVGDEAVTPVPLQQADDAVHRAAAPVGVHDPPGTTDDDPRNTAHVREPMTPRTRHLNAVAMVEVVSPLNNATADSLADPQPAIQPPPNLPQPAKQPDLSAFGGAAASSGEPPRRPLFSRPRPVRLPASRREFSIFTPPGEDRKREREGDEKADETVKTLAGIIEALQWQVEDLGKQLKAIKNDEDHISEIPKMNIKDIEKPFKFTGDKWNLWEGDFMSFLARRDRRWKDILVAVKKKSDAPLSPKVIEEIRDEPKIKDFMRNDLIFETFVQHLYEYLKTYTGGDIHTMIMANGPDKALESWRRLCDQGKSRRPRPMRDEKRSLFHPKQATADTLIKAIAEWEKRLAEYVEVTGDHMEAPEKIMCLEDLCPENIQKYLSDKALMGKIESYLDYKDAIDMFFYEEKRWSKSTKAKVNAIQEAPASYESDAHGEDDENTECQPYDLFQLSAVGTNGDPWTNSLLGDINALVRNKIKGKGKGSGKFDKGGKGKGGDKHAMDVDSSGDGRSKAEGKQCYECNEYGHFGRDCPVRKARLAAEGSAFQKGDKGGKAEKGGGKYGKGGKFGKGGKGGGTWPSAAQWKTMYPGPSPAQWNSWYGWAGNGQARANLFEAPNQLSSIQALFQGAGAYSIVPKKKAAPAGKVTSSSTATKVQNRFEELADKGDVMDVAVEDLIKPESRNRMRKKKKAQMCASGEEESKCDQDARGAMEAPAEELPSETSEAMPDLSDSDDEEEFCHNCEKLVRTTIRQRCPACRRYGTLSGADEEARRRAAAEATRVCRRVACEARQGLNLTSIFSPCTDACCAAPPPGLPVGPTPGDLQKRRAERRQAALHSKEKQAATNAYFSKTRVSSTSEIHKFLPSKASKWKGQKFNVNNCDDALIDFLCGKNLAKVIQRPNICMFNEIRNQSNLCPVTGIKTQQNDEGKHSNMFSGIDPSKWEELLAVVDSGATIPVLHPATGKAYAVEESAASRAGVEYEVANGDTTPNLGQKRMAVLTEEGTMRGYSSQCADVSKALQSVRALVGSKHAVCFGLGPDGNDHLIINRVSGEINRMIDDGVNYLQKLMVIPPDQIDAVHAQLEAMNYGDAESWSMPFQRQGR